MLKSTYRVALKRLLDLAVVIPAIIVLLPVSIVVWVCVRFALGSPAIFRQRRIGRGNRQFTLYKFRTMTDARTSDGALAPDEQRLTSFGKFLRATSLDEIPQLWNVFLGDMSLVGPRPLLIEYMEYYTDEQKRRHDVTPGITGWAQVHGRNDISWEDRFSRDLWYVDNFDFSVDLQILFRTLLTLVSQKGVSHEGSATMPRYDHVMQARNSVLIFGGGGHAKVVISTLVAAGQRIKGILDDDPDKWDTTLVGIPILGPMSDESRWPDLPAIVAIGDNTIRRKVVERYQRRWVSAIHPAAWVDKSAQLGGGSVVFAGAVVQSEAILGNHVIINTAATIDHDCIVEDFGHVGPGTNLGGTVRMKVGAFLGCGTRVIPGICLGAGCTVGAGSIVINNIPDEVVAVGCPATIVKRKSAA